jgi:NTE family protein
MTRKITLALGGGGMKGYAHIGVIRQLEKEGYEIVAVAGTSIGGIIGSLYCSGYSPDEIESFIKGINQRTFFNQDKGEQPAILGLGGLFKLLKSKIGERDFSTLKIPFLCTAVDMKSGSEVILNSGLLIDAVQATSAMPGIFPAKIYDDLYLVDGGIFDPVPVAVARWMAPKIPVIAVCLSPEMENWDGLPHLQVPRNTPIPPAVFDSVFQLRLGQALRVFIDSMDIMTNMLAELRLTIEKPDFILRPPIKEFAIFNDADPSELIKRGENAVKSNLESLIRIFSTSQSVSRWLKPSRLPGKLLSDILSINELPTLKNSK